MAYRSSVLFAAIMVVTMACIATAETSGGKDNNKTGDNGEIKGAVCKLIPKNQDGVQKCVIKNGKEYCRMTLSRRVIKWCKIKIHS